jgi:hypothetical protein
VAPSRPRNRPRVGVFLEDLDEDDVGLACPRGPGRENREDDGEDEREDRTCDAGGFPNRDTSGVSCYRAPNWYVGFAISRVVSQFEIGTGSTQTADPVPTTALDPAKLAGLDSIH